MVSSRILHCTLHLSGHRERKNKIRHWGVSRTCILVSLASWFVLPSHADVLDDWNDAVLNAIRRENTPPALAARNLAILHLAIYDAINSIERTHTPYLGFVRCTGAASKGGAALGAAYESAVSLFPSQKARFDALRTAGLLQLEANPPATNGFAVGTRAAQALIDHRTSDGSQTSRTYIPSDKPGSWRRTRPFFRPPELPQWACLQPFALARCDQFRPPPPPALDSERYAEDFHEVKRLGGKSSTARTQYETQTALFWSDFSGTVTPPGHWNQIARAIAADEKLTLPNKARLLALLNLALADAAVVAWDAKFTYNAWRPVTAIHRAEEDANPATAADPGWQSLLVSPAFPEYVSGHSTFSGAAGEVLARFFQRDHMHFSAVSDTLPNVVRSYDSLATVVAEIGHSRILGGIHFTSADQQGQAAGRAVGRQIFQNNLLPSQSAAIHPQATTR